MAEFFTSTFGPYLGTTIFTVLMILCIIVPLLLAVAYLTLAAAIWTPVLVGPTLYSPSLPLPAYVAVALLLVGGIVCVPGGVAALLRWVPVPRHPLVLLAVQRARHQRHTATIAVAGVVASLALSVALTVMVASFRDSVTQWLDTVLPADLYARSAATSAAAEQAWFDATLLPALRAVPGVARLQAHHVRDETFDLTFDDMLTAARDRIAIAAEKGFALRSGGVPERTTTIAVPVIVFSTAVGALCTTFPTSAMALEEACNKYVPELQTAADSISALFEK